MCPSGFDGLDSDLDGVPDDCDMCPGEDDSFDADLDDAMRRWLASPDKGVALDRERNRVRVSEIFDWFEEDFEAQGGVLATIERYVSTDDAAWLRGAGVRPEDAGSRAHARGSHQ